MTRWLAAIVVMVTSTAYADDDRKTALDAAASKAAGEAFAEAVAAEDRNDLAAAIESYDRAWTIAPHPNTAYNLAQVYVRKNKLADAIRMYTYYVTLAPQAKDRAKVEAVIARLAARPATIRLRSDSKLATSIDLTEAYVIVDGEIYASPGDERVKSDASKVWSLDVETTHHYPTIDVVTALTSTTISVRGPLEPGVSRTAEVRARARAAGSLVVGASGPFSIYLAGAPARVDGKRVDVGPGRHTLTVRDRTRECPPIDVTVPKGGAVLFVSVTPLEAPGAGSVRPDRCRRARVKQEALLFP